MPLCCLPVLGGVRGRAAALVAPPADPGDGDENRAALAHRRVLGAPASRETEYDRTVQSNRYV